jgi:hypothetical protein
LKVLLDNCIPRKFRRHLPDHDVVHAGERGWAGLANGRLLRAAADEGFEVVLTVDKSLQHQQNKAELPVPVILVIAVSNHERELVRVLPRIASLLNQDLQRRVYIIQRN